MSYQNVSVDDGRSKFVQVEPDGTLNELTFSAKRTNVPVGGGYRVTAANFQTSFVSKKNIAPAGEVPVYFTESGSVKFNCLSGDTARIDQILDRMIAHLQKARDTYAADNGLVPPASAGFTDPAP